ncbi:MAG: hypothetical protein C4562_05320 [Actinobacteria bacterium]|nr:MAG: hypothetical protein C4562_05320 [Actinomycetota bacterium]
MEEEIGKVTHYFNHLNVAIIELSKGLKKGDTIHIQGYTSDWTQTAEEMQVEHETIEEAKKGQVIGLKVKDHAREGDSIYLVKD